MIKLGGHSRGRFRDLLRKTTGGVVIATVAVLLSYTAFRQWTFVAPPADEGPALDRQVRVESTPDGLKMSLGQDVLLRQDGIWRLFLQGNPRQMGHAHGVLAGRLVDAVDAEIDAIVRLRSPTGLRQWAWNNLVRWRLRALTDNLDPRHVVEVAAYGRSVTGGADATAFHRVMHRHAMYDLAARTRRVDQSPLVNGMAFAAWGGATSDGHLLVGRVFELQGLLAADREKMVMFVQPEHGQAFVSVGWPGLFGVVSGVNSARLLVAVNVARTDQGFRSGTPALFLARSVLEQARTIADAAKLIDKAAVMRPFSLFVADGKSSEAVVLEVSPGTVAVRRAKRRHIAAVSHLMHARYKGDAQNDRVRRYTCSDTHHKRMKQLIGRFVGRMDAETVALIMRNRTGIDDRPLALGHRGALDALSATHGIVVDLTSLVMWVSRGPNLLGPMVPIDLRAVFGLTVEAGSRPEALPQDRVLDDPAYRRRQVAVEQMRYARQLRADGDLEGAIDYAQRAVRTVESMPDAQKLVADLCWQAGDVARARRHYKEFLRHDPPYKADVEVAEERLNP